MTLLNAKIDIPDSQPVSLKDLSDQAYVRLFLIIVLSLQKVLTLKTIISPHFWPAKGFMGTVLNLALSSLHGGSIKITLSVPLRKNEVQKVEQVL